MFSNSNSSNISAYSSNPLDHISSQKKLEFNSNSLSAFEIGEFFGKNKSDGKSNQKPKNFVLRLNVEYRKVFNDVIINEVKIDNQGNKTEQTLNVSNVNFSEQNGAKFKRFLNKVKSVFESDYKREEKVEIDLNFKFDGINNDNFIINCFYIIKNISLEENDFKDQDILNNEENQGLTFVLNTLNRQ